MWVGIFSFEQPLAAWGEVSHLLKALAPYHDPASGRNWESGLMRLLWQPITADNSHTSVYEQPDSGIAAVLWGRLDRTDELAKKLGQPTCSRPEALLVAAWLRWGVNCPKQLDGDFAFAICDPHNKSVFLARDVFGTKPLFYRLDDHGLSFATSASVFREMRIGHCTISQEWLARFLVNLSWSHELTGFNEIRKLPAAHSLLVSQNGNSQLCRFHEFINDSSFERHRNPEWLEAYRGVWQEVVSDRIPATGSFASENSGGVDSGSITSEVARQLGHDIARLHGLGFCYDPLEPDHIMATAMKWGICRNILFSHREDEDIEAQTNRELAVAGYPMEHSNGMGHQSFYSYCQNESISTLFSGFGGDEGVTYPGGMPARLELFDRQEWRALWDILPGTAALRVGRLLKTAQHARRTPDLHKGFLASWQLYWPHRLLSDTVINEYGLENEFFASATYDEKFRKVNDAAIYLLGRQYLPTRLENCSLAASAYGIDYVWPMLDRRLIQQWLSTPSIWKVGPGGIGRFLHRSVADGVCPSLVAWKPSKDMSPVESLEITEQIDNRPLFRNLLAELADVPSELSDILPLKELRARLEKAILEDQRGSVIRSCWSANLSRLQRSRKWLTP